MIDPGAAHAAPRAPVAPADQCPRCGGGFRCGMAGPGPCACTSVQLDAPTLLALRARYSGCLCLSCLQVLAAGGALETPDTVC